MPNSLKAIGLFFLDFVEIIVGSLVFFIIVYLVFLQPHQVNGNSMLDNFYDKEYLLTDKISYRFREPKRGEVVIFKAPENEDYEYIKRFIASPGERIKISNGKVYINGLALDESSYLKENTYTAASSFLTEDQEIIIPEDKYVVLGDNRSHSSDSRAWGFVPKENIIGQAWFRYWPLHQAGLIFKTTYPN